MSESHRGCHQGAPFCCTACLIGSGGAQAVVLLLAALDAASMAGHRERVALQHGWLRNSVGSDVVLCRRSSQLVLYAGAALFGVVMLETTCSYRLLGRILSELWLWLLMLLPCCRSGRCRGHHATSAPATACPFHYNRAVAVLLTA